MRQHTHGQRLNGGEQRSWRFPNGYGASVVRHDFSYGHEEGKWELAVIKGPSWEICYGTPITDDVIGWLDDNGVNELLEKIEALTGDYPMKKEQLPQAEMDMNR